MLGAGLLIIDDLFSPTFALYPVASVVFALGLGVMALGAWITRTLPRWIPALWLAAIVVGAGLYLYSAPDRVPQDELRT